MYKLAVVPKISDKVEYSTAYGSNHDKKHTDLCLRKNLKQSNIIYQIIYEKDFLNKYHTFDGVIFVGLSETIKDVLPLNKEINLFTWSFNQVDWVNNYRLFDNFDIIFEQSTINLDKYNYNNKKIIYTPLAFQSDRINKKTLSPQYDIVFNGTLDRSRRATSKFHRKEIIENLLKSGLSVLNYNGRPQEKVERELIDSLLKYKNFKYIKKWGEPSEYSDGKYALNIPFHELGSMESININWGLEQTALENENFLIHWDIFRCIGAQSNMITHDNLPTRELGLNETNCSFYKSDTTNVCKLSDEIIEIVDKGEIKNIPNEIWYKNSYEFRWNFIFREISKTLGKF